MPTYTRTAHTSNAVSIQTLTICGNTHTQLNYVQHVSDHTALKDAQILRFSMPQPIIASCAVPPSGHGGTIRDTCYLPDNKMAPVDACASEDANVNGQQRGDNAITATGQGLSLDAEQGASQYF